MWINITYLTGTLLAGIQSTICHVGGISQVHDLFFFFWKLTFWLLVFKLDAYNSISSSQFVFSCFVLTGLLMKFPAKWVWLQMSWNPGHNLSQTLIWRSNKVISAFIKIVMNINWSLNVWLGKSVYGLGGSAILSLIK